MAMFVGRGPVVATLIKNSQALAAQNQPAAPVYTPPAPNPNVISTMTNFRPSPTPAPSPQTIQNAARLFRGIR